MAGSLAPERFNAIPFICSGYMSGFNGGNGIAYNSFKTHEASSFTETVSLTAAVSRLCILIITIIPTVVTRVITIEIDEARG